MPTQVFSCEYCKNFNNNLRWLLLSYLDHFRCFAGFWIPLHIYKCYVICEVIISSVSGHIQAIFKHYLRVYSHISGANPGKQFGGWIELGGLGERSESLPAGVLGGRISYENFSGIQRPLEWLKIDSNLMNDGFMAKLKSSMEFKKVYDLNTSSETYVQTDEHKYKLTNLRMNSRR